MGKYVTEVDEHLVLPGRVRLTPGQEHMAGLWGLGVPAPIPVRFVVDTGSGRTTLIPSVLDQLNPELQSTVRVETALGATRTSLHWVRLEFPGTSLAPVPAIAVARLPLPPSLASFHGLLGRDLLRRWEHLFYEGRRGRCLIRNMPSLLSGWLRRWL